MQCPAHSKCSANTTELPFLFYSHGAHSPVYVHTNEWGRQAEAGGADRLCGEGEGETRAGLEAVGRNAVGWEGGEGGPGKALVPAKPLREGV